MATNIGTAFFNVTFNTAAARREITALVSRLNSSFGLVSGLAVVGATAAVAGLTRATFELGQASLATANEFEQGFASVRKTMDDGSLSAAEATGVFNRLRGEIRQLALETPIEIADLNRVAALGGQLGIAATDIAEFTEVVSELGVTTNISVDDVATGVARLANILGLADEDFRAIGDTLVNLGNNLAAEEDEILRFSLRIAAAGRIANFTQDQVQAIAGAFASVGVPAERGGTAVQRTIIKISEAVAGGEEAIAGFAEVAGVSAQQFINMWETEPAEAFTRFVEGLGRSGSQAFGILSELELAEQRTLQALLSIANAGPLLRQSFEIGAGSTGALAKESDIFFNTTQANIQLLQNAVNDAGITIGSVIQGPFNALLTGLTDWIGSNQHLIRQIGEQLGGALERLVPILLDLVDGAVKFGSAFIRFIDPFDNFTEGIARGLQPAEEFADFMERGFSFDPSLAAFTVNVGEFFGVAQLGVERLTLAEDDLRKKFEAGAPVVRSMSDALVDLQDELRKGGEELSVFGVTEILDEAELTEAQMRAVILRAQELGAIIPPAILDMLGLRNVTDSWMNLWRDGLPDQGDVLGLGSPLDFGATDEELEEAAKAAALYSENIGKIRVGLVDTGLSLEEYLNLVGRINPEIAAFVTETGRAQVEMDVFTQSLSAVRDAMDFRPAWQAIFGTGDLINGIEQATRTIESSGEEVLLHGRDFADQAIENLNTIATFEANLILLFARGFEEVARLLAEQGPEFAHVAEDFVQGFADPAVLEKTLESGGTITDELKGAVADELTKQGVDPALLEFASQFGADAVLREVYGQGLITGEQYGEGFRIGFLRRIAGLLGGLGITVPSGPAFPTAGEIIKNNEGGPLPPGVGSTGGNNNVISLSFQSSGATLTDAARSAQIINALVLT